MHLLRYMHLAAALDNVRAVRRKMQAMHLSDRALTTGHHRLCNCRACALRSPLLQHRAPQTAPARSFSQLYMDLSTATDGCQCGSYRHVGVSCLQKTSLLEPLRLCRADVM